MVRAFAHGAMGLRNDLLWWTHNWCNKGRDMCYPLSGMMHIKSEREAYVAAAGFLSPYLSGSLPYA